MAYIQKLIGETRKFSCQKPSIQELTALQTWIKDTKAQFYSYSISRDPVTGEFRNIDVFIRAADWRACVAFSERWEQGLH